MLSLFGRRAPRGPRPTTLAIAFPPGKAFDDVARWIAGRGRWPLLVEDRYWVSARPGDAAKLFGIVERGGPGRTDLAADDSGKLADAIAEAGPDAQPGGRFASDALMLFVLAAHVQGANSMDATPFGTAHYVTDAPALPTWTHWPPTPQPAATDAE